MIENDGRRADWSADDRALAETFGTVPLLAAFMAAYASGGTRFDWCHSAPRADGFFAARCKRLA